VEFDLLEHAATAMFTTEYELRPMGLSRSRDERNRDPLWGRLRYMRSLSALVDFVSVMPCRHRLLRRRFARAAPASLAVDV